MKRALTVLLVFTLLGGLVSAHAGGDDFRYTLHTPDPASAPVPVGSKADASGAAYAQKQLGAIHVAVTGASLQVDMAGTTSLVVALRWSHQLPEPSTFLFSVMMTAQQNGSELGPGLPVQGYAYGASSESVPAGVEQEVYYFLESGDAANDIYLSISEFNMEGLMSGNSLNVVFKLP